MWKSYALFFLALAFIGFCVTLFDLGAKLLISFFKKPKEEKNSRKKTYRN